MITLLAKVLYLVEQVVAEAGYELVVGPVVHVKNAERQDFWVQQPAMLVTVAWGQGQVEHAGPATSIGLSFYGPGTLDLEGTELRLAVDDHIAWRAGLTKLRRWLHRWPWQAGQWPLSDVERAGLAVDRTGAEILAVHRTGEGVSPVQPRKVPTVVLVDRAPVGSTGADADADWYWLAEDSNPAAETVVYRLVEPPPTEAASGRPHSPRREPCASAPDSRPGG